MEARRHYNNPDFMPKWKPGPRGISKPLKTCVNPKCIKPVHEKLIKPLFTSTTELEEILGIKSSDNSLVLCQHCYNAVYRQTHPSKWAVTIHWTGLLDWNTGLKLFPFLDKVL